MTRVTTFAAAALIIASAAQLDAAGNGARPLRLDCARAGGSRLVCRAHQPFNRLAHADLEVVEATTATGVDIQLSLVKSGGERAALPPFYGNVRWASCELVRDDADRPRPEYVAIGDFNGDQREDVAVLAECVTGIGPTGTTPFLAGAVYFGNGAGGFTTTEAVNRALTRLASRSCRPARCDVAALAREAAKPSRSGAVGGRLSQSHDAYCVDFGMPAERPSARRGACAPTSAE